MLEKGGIMYSRELLVRVAWLYYIEGLTQKEIAEILDVPRIKVTRILDKAKKEGLVYIDIVDPLTNCLQIEKLLKGLFKLKDAMVVPTLSDIPEKIKDSLGKATAIYLRRNLRNNMILATAWGSTISYAIPYFRPKKISGLKVVSIMGGLAPGSRENPFEIASKIANIFGGKSYYLHAPAITDSEESSRILMNQEQVTFIFEMAKRANLGLVSVGDVSPSSTLVRVGFITYEDLEKAKEKGAIGEILGRFYDADGKRVYTELDKRIIGLDLEDLKKVENVIGVSGGKTKIEPLLGAIRGGYIDTLITDEETAKALIERHEKADQLKF